MTWNRRCLRIWMILDSIRAYDVSGFKCHGCPARPPVDPLGTLSINIKYTGVHGNVSYLRVLLLTFEENDRALFVDVPPNGLFFEDRADIVEHEIAFDQLQASALSTTGSQSLVKTLIDEYKRPS